MTTETVGQAVEQVQGPARLIEASVGEFAKVLPSFITPEKYARWGLSVIRKGLGGGMTEQAAKQREAWQRVLGCEPGRLSLMSALMDCASLGLEPGRTYHLVPFGSEITGMTDYKGEIELVYRAMRQPVIAMLVRQADKYEPQGPNTPPYHKYEAFTDRGPIIGGYAYAQFAPNVYSLVAEMSEADFLKHRDKAKTKTVWDEWPEDMRLKTLIRRLRKWVPWSVEIQPVSIAELT
jgi:phage RecT family recombinase